MRKSRLELDTEKIVCRVLEDGPVDPDLFVEYMAHVLRTHREYVRNIMRGLIPDDILEIKDKKLVIGKKASCSWFAKQVQCLSGWHDGRYGGVRCRIYYYIRFRTEDGSVKQDDLIDFLALEGFSQRDIGCALHGLLVEGKIECLPRGQTLKITEKELVK